MTSAWYRLYLGGLAPSKFQPQISQLLQHQPLRISAKRVAEQSARDLPQWAISNPASMDRCRGAYSATWRHFAVVEGTSRAVSTALLFLDFGRPSTCRPQEQTYMASIDDLEGCVSPWFLLEVYNCYLTKVRESSSSSSESHKDVLRLPIVTHFQRTPCSTIIHTENARQIKVRRPLGSTFSSINTFERQPPVS
jgi:hypothetical protein